MKIKLFALTMLLAAFTLQSCDSDNDDIPQNDIPESILSVFKTMFPNTTAEWEKTGNTYNAEFWNNGVETDVWFSSTGQWLRTEVDYTQPLPSAVQTYVNTNFAGYVIEDVDYVTTPSGDYFDIELEKNGSPDIILKIKQDGTLFS